jgi:hypothetical protein
MKMAKKEGAITRYRGMWMWIGCSIWESPSLGMNIRDLPLRRLEVRLGSLDSGMI